MYKGYIIPVLENAAPVWHSGHTRTQTDNLESIKKKVCRIILGQLYIRYDQALVALALETLVKRRVNLCTTFALKA